MKKSGQITINSRIVNNPLLEHGVKLSVWECYLSVFQIEPGGLVEATFQDECLKLQNIDNIYNEMVFLQGKAVATGLSEEEANRIGSVAGSSATNTCSSTKGIVMKKNGWRNFRH
jgi:hypothetical protein